MYASRLRYWYQMPKLRARIAIVDDDASVRSALCRLLRVSDFNPRAYDSAAEFLGACIGFRPHCAIVDLHMPGMSGLEVLQRLQRNRLAIPVIVITGHDAPLARTECLAAGARAYLTKPVDEDILISAVRETVEFIPQTL